MHEALKERLEEQDQVTERLEARCEGLQELLDTRAKSLEVQEQGL